MSNLTDFIEEYAHKSFLELAFCEIDALILSQLSYIDYSAIAGNFNNDCEITLKEAAKQYFDLYDEDELKEKISIVYKAGMLLKQCAQTNRYANIRLLRYVNNVNDRIDKQFSAITFYLDDSTALIAYRGTDTSITGIKESAMLSYMFPVPAQIEGLHYLQESATLAKRNIIVCGHSKGGNLATFAAVNCSNSLKKKIIGIYEFDAPGFPLEFINRYDYKLIENKIFSYIPESSIIGCMLYHNDARRIVKSSNDNIKQHQVSSWEIEKNHFLFAEETDEQSKFIDKYLKQLSQAVGEENTEDVFLTIFNFIDDAGIKGYEDFKRFDISKLIRVIVSLKNFDDNKKDLIEDTIRQALKELSHLFYEEKLSQIGIKLKKDNEE